MFTPVDHVYIYIYMAWTWCIWFTITIIWSYDYWSQWRFNYYYHMISDYYHMSITIITIIWIYYYYRMFLPMYGVSLLVNLRSFFSSPRMWSNGIPSVSRSANTCKADDMTTFCRVILGKPLVVNDGFYICIIINMYIYIIIIYVMLCDWLFFVFARNGAT